MYTFPENLYFLSLFLFFSNKISFYALKEFDRNIRKMIFSGTNYVGTTRWYTKRNKIINKIYIIIN